MTRKNNNTTKVKELKLGEILNDKQFELVYNFLNTKDFKSLREYLNTISDDLQKKGILSDYLYYYLEFKFKELKNGQI